MVQKEDANRSAVSYSRFSCLYKLAIFISVKNTTRTGKTVQSTTNVSPERSLKTWWFQWARRSWWCPRSQTQSSWLTATQWASGFKCLKNVKYFFNVCIYKLTSRRLLLAVHLSARRYFRITPARHRLLVPHCHPVVWSCNSCKERMCDTVHIFILVSGVKQ